MLKLRLTQFLYPLLSSNCGAVKLAMCFSTLLIALFACGVSLAQTKSRGVYRIPFVNGTTVKITGDAKTHKPAGRIDMIGTGGSTYKIVAAADGIVRYVVDNFSKQIDSSSGQPCTNNYVWIEHATGEWTKYSHMQTGSTTNKAKIKVGQFVRAGAYLGDEGKVGCASGNHLHFEVGVPRATDPIETVGGFLKDNAGSKRNRDPRICNIPKGIFVDDQKYEARDVVGNIRAGSSEVARHGVKEEDYQCLVDQAVSSDYKLVWVDGFNVNGKIYFNAVFRPEGDAKWSAVHNLNGSQYQDEVDKRKGLGFRLYHVDSYLAGNQVRYAAIFVKDGGPAVTAYHGLTAAQHQQKMDQLTAGAWRPKNVSVVSIGGNRFYTALYESAKVGGWEAKSFLTASEYQTLADENKQKGRQLVYLNAYEHVGQPRFTAIWNSATQGPFKARHGLTGQAYQSEWESATKVGLLTRAVTGYEQNGQVRYAAVWRK
jgi:murein DD-endopeptidase MepM/ murein hydrolase activator NlpD